MPCLAFLTDPSSNHGLRQQDFVALRIIVSVNPRLFLRELKHSAGKPFSLVIQGLVRILCRAFHETTLKDLHHSLSNQVIRELELVRSVLLRIAFSITLNVIAQSKLLAEMLICTQLLLPITRY